MTKILQFDNLSFHYEDENRSVQILDEVTISFEKGMFYTIVGPSGVGKTTTLALASAMDYPKTGEILYNGKRLRDIGLTKYRNEKIGIVFQSYYLINYMTGIQNILTAMEVAKYQQKNKKEKALELIRLVGLSEEEANSHVQNLSGGQQQRIAIARALATDPSIILADEPTGNLDRRTSDGIIKLFKDLAHKNNKCVIVVTHSERVAAQSDLVLRLEDGKFEIEY